MSTIIANTAEQLNKESVRYSTKINQLLKQGLEFEKTLSPVACDKVYTAPNVKATEIVQAYQSGWTPKGSAAFDAVDNHLQPLKVDLQFTSDDLEKFWSSWRAEWWEVGKREGEWSFPKYLYKEVFLPKIIEEMNRNSYHGERSEPTNGVAGASINSVDGFAKVIADAITASKITPIAVGAWAANTAVNQMETFVDSLPVLYRNTPGDIYASPEVIDMYWTDHRDKFGFGAGVSGNENNELRVKRSGKRLVPMNCMSGSDRIIFTPKGNMIWGTRQGYSTYPKIRWKDGDVRVLKGTAEFYRFYGFNYWDELFVNDQA